MNHFESRSQFVLQIVEMSVRRQRDGMQNKQQSL